MRFWPKNRRFLWIALWQLIFLSVSFSKNGIAGECETYFEGEWADWASFLENFRDFQRILFLADGKWALDARFVAKSFPTKEVTGTDIRLSPRLLEFYVNDRQNIGNLRLLKVDTTKRLPFLDNAFDLVFMKSGLCRCRHSSEVCCGGLTPEVHAKSFLSEVYRILDKSNPSFMAILHGAKIPVEDVPIWVEAAHSLPGILIKILVNHNNYYHALKVQSNRST